MRGTIYEILRQKYDEVEVPDDIFDFEEILRNEGSPRLRKIKRKRLIKNIAVAVITVFIIIAGTTILLWNVNNSESVDKKAESKLPEYVDDMIITNNIFNFGTREDNSIYKVKIKEILGYSSKICENYSYPITKVKAEVINTLFGDEKKEIEFFIPGGVWKIEDLKKSGLNYDVNRISSYSDNDYIKINYSENMVIADPVVNNIYVTNVYSDNDTLYVYENSIYGFKEYDETTDSIKNNMGEWEKIDLTNYIK